MGGEVRFWTDNVPLAATLQRHQVPGGHLEKRSFFIVSCPYLVKSTHDLQTGVSVLTLDVLASADIPSSESLKVMFNCLSVSSGNKVEQFLQLEKSCNGKLRFCDSPWLSCQMIHTAACKKHVGEDF